MIETIALPNRLEPVQALAFIAELDAVDDDVEEYHFDFASLGRMSPFGLLVLASALRSFRRSLPDKRFRIVNHEKQTYAAHMGLFQAFGAKVGNEPGEAPGGRTYLPITVVTRRDVGNEARATEEGFNETLEERAKRMAELLLQSEDGDAVRALTYALREVMRNVFEHSGCDELSYCGQYWPSYGFVEVAICDTGMGVRRSLEPNPDVEIGCDRDALRASILPGVSGKVYRGRKPNPNDDWAHSGYGLFMTSGLSRGFGRFVIASGDAALVARGDSHRFVDTRFDGTALSIRVAVNEDIDFTAEMDALRRRGRQIARQIQGAILTPSVASGMLRSGV